MRATVATYKSALQSAAGRCLDSELYDLINQAMQRLLPEGDWVGTVARYIFCARQSCITLPSEVETMQGYFIPNNPTGRPGHVRDDWYEMVDNGPGVLTDTSAYAKTMDTAVDRGQTSVFFDVCGIKNIKVYCDVAETAGAYITVKGYDENFNWIRTQVLGAWIDGERILLNNATPQTSVSLFTSVTSVTKPVTNGAIRVYQYDSGPMTQDLIAVYDYWETLPCYRRYFIPGLGPQAVSSVSPIVIKALCKRAYRPVMADTDELLIANVGALTNAIRCIIMETDQQPEKSATYWQTAIALLSKERENYRGKNPGNEPIRHMDNASRRLTLATYKSMIYRAQDGTIARDDLMITNRVNESVQRLLNEGDWLGTIVRYNLYCAQSTITLPAGLETLIGYNTPNNNLGLSWYTVPGHVRNNWYEYIDNGPGLLSETRTFRMNPQQMVPRDDAVTYLNVSPAAGETGMLIKVYADVPEDADATILLTGLDGQGNFIRSQDTNGKWYAGEIIAINHTTPQTSVHYFSQITGVQKPVTNGVVRLYQYNVVPAPNQEEIAFYQAWEQVPCYRRYFLPGISSLYNAQPQNGPILLSIIAKVRFKPVSYDTDLIQIANFSALKQMLMCIEAEEKGNMNLGMQCLGTAKALLNKEIVNNNGKGSKETLNIQVRGWSAGEIPCLI